MTILCTGIPWIFIKIRLQILLCVIIHLYFFKKKKATSNVQPNRMGSKIKIHSGSTKSKVISMHRGKTKELKANKQFVVEFKCYTYLMFVIFGVTFVSFILLYVSLPPGKKIFYIIVNLKYTQKLICISGMAQNILLALVNDVFIVILDDANIKKKSNFDN